MTAAAACAVTLAARAASLNPKDLASDPALVVHLDADALKSTSVGKLLLADQDVQTKLAAVQAMFSFDLRSNLHGLTIYTTMDHSQEGVLILYADFEPDRLITLAKAFPGYHSETNGSYVIYNWLDEKKKGNDGAPRIYAAISGHRLIFGKSEPVLTAALDVMAGKADNYTGTKMLLKPADGELIVAQGAVLKFTVEDGNPSAAVFQASKVVRFKLGEASEKVGAVVSFEAKDADSANQISAMLNGLLALVKFQKDPNALKLANMVNLQQDGERVTVSLSVPTADVVAMLKQGAAEKADNQGAADTNSAPAKTQ